MNEGVCIIIERMKTNPEDFENDKFEARLMVPSRSSTWYWLAKMVCDDEDVFTPEERQAVAEALHEVHRRNFTAKVLDLLANPPAHPGAMREIEDKLVQAMIYSGGTTIGSISANNSGNYIIADSNTAR